VRSPPPRGLAGRSALYQHQFFAGGFDRDSHTHRPAYAPWVGANCSGIGVYTPAYGPVCGLESTNPFNYAIDPKLKTPYSENYTLGVQRELPGNFQLDATYVGRFAHRLLAQADGMQAVDFKDLYQDSCYRKPLRPCPRKSAREPRRSRPSLSSESGCQLGAL